MLPARKTDIYSHDGSCWDFNGHEGQWRALESLARFILVLAGWQSGKTLIGPRWMLEEIAACGAGDYLVASPTFPLMSLKLLPEYKDLFVNKLGLGLLKEHPRPIFTLGQQGRRFMRATGSPLWQDRSSKQTHIHFGHAADPDSLESATYKAAHLDEAGQKKFKRASWDAIQGRLSINMGRVLITTRPYYIGWLKAEVYDRWKAGDTDYDVISFRSIDNPAFPPEEYERQRRRLPGWKFRMMYDGLWERPAGMIYDCFSRETHVVRDFRIPGNWQRLWGLDFGGVHTACVFLARDPEADVFYLYRTYLAGKKPKSQHARDIKKSEPGLPSVCVGGSRSEDEWRIDFADVGLPIDAPPIKLVEVGIDRVYEMLGGERSVKPPLPIRLKVLASCEDFIDEIESYSRELDDNDEPTEKIENKEQYHLLDALRYIVSRILQPRVQASAEWLPM